MSEFYSQENGIPSAPQNTESEIKTGKKNKKIFLCIAILVYTILIVGVTVKIDRTVLAKQLENSWKNAFSETADSSNNQANGIFNNTTLETTKPQIETKNINLNQTVTIGNVMELTLEASEWLDEIKPSNTSGVYSYYEDKDGEKYFVVKGKIKNLSGGNLDIDYAHKSQILINDTYEANVTIKSEETDGTSFYGSIKPLQTLNVVIFASVSDELYNICENVELTLNMLSDSSRVNYYFDIDDPHETYVINFSNK